MSRYSSTSDFTSSEGENSTQQSSGCVFMGLLVVIVLAIMAGVIGMSQSSKKSTDNNLTIDSNSSQGQQLETLPVSTSNMKTGTRSSSDTRSEDDTRSSSDRRSSSMKSPSSTRSPNASSKNKNDDGFVFQPLTTTNSNKMDNDFALETGLASTLKLGGGVEASHSSWNPNWLWGVFAAIFAIFVVFCILAHYVPTIGGCLPTPVLATIGAVLTAIGVVACLYKFGCKGPKNNTYSLGYDSQFSTNYAYGNMNLSQQPQYVSGQDYSCSNACKNGLIWQILAGLIITGLTIFSICFLVEHHSDMRHSFTGFWTDLYDSLDNQSFLLVQDDKGDLGRSMGSFFVALLIGMFFAIAVWLGRKICSPVVWDDENRTTCAMLSILLAIVIIVSIFLDVLIVEGFMTIADDFSSMETTKNNFGQGLSKLFYYGARYLLVIFAVVAAAGFFSSCCRATEGAASSNRFMYCQMLIVAIGLLGWLVFNQFLIDHHDWISIIVVATLVAVAALFWFSASCMGGPNAQACANSCFGAIPCFTQMLGMFGLVVSFTYLPTYGFDLTEFCKYRFFDNFVSYFTGCNGCNAGTQIQRALNDLISGWEGTSLLAAWAIFALSIVFLVIASYFSNLG